MTKNYDAGKRASHVGKNILVRNLIGMIKIEKKPDQKLKALAPGNHLCFIYKTTEEHRQVVMNYIQQGLEQGQKVIYIAEAPEAQNIFKALYENEVDVDSCLKSGQLGMLSAAETFLRAGIFDPDEMITFLQEETGRALDEGYTALRTAGEMSWALKGVAGCERLIEYESTINDFFIKSKHLAMCQYDQRRFEPGVILDVLRTHPIAVIGTEVFENFYYIPPEDFLGPHQEEAKLNKWLFRLSERRWSEKTLRASEEKYRFLVKSLPGIVYKGFKDLSVEFFDNKIELLTGYPSEDFNSKGLKWTDLIFPADLAASKERFIRAIKTDKSYTREYRIRTKNGSLRWIGDRGQIVCNEQGEMEYVSGIFFDVTEHKLIEEALYKEKEKFRVLVEESPFGISLIGKDGKCEYVNARFIEMFGYNLNDIQHGNEWIRKAYPNRKHRRQSMAVWFNAMKNMREVGQTQPHIFNVRCKDGADKVVKFRGAMTATGQQFVIYEDLTEQKRMEILLRQAQKMEAIGTLAGGIAHDFNNILSAIMGNADISLYNIPQDSPLRYNIEQILKASGRARDLVKQILTFSRQTEQELRPVKVSIIVKEVLKLLRASLPTTIAIRQKITADHDTVLADPSQIHQVLMNLATNAHHAMHRQGGILEVGLRNVSLDAEAAAKYPELPPGSYLKLKVSDTGHGMTPEVIERIFDPYFTTKEKGVGTGLGLAVIHGIIKSIGGAISVASEPGIGSTFSVFFPLVETKNSLEPLVVETIPVGNERILFVDDEEFIADLGKRILQRLGYDVVVRTSSIEALKAFQTQPEKFDLIITDMTMPQMTGNTLARELLQIRPDIPIIICTGFSEMISENKAKEMGIKGFVMKPFVIQEMAKIIRQVLDG